MPIHLTLLVHRKMIMIRIKRSFALSFIILLTVALPVIASSGPTGEAGVAVVDGSGGIGGSLFNDMNGDGQMDSAEAQAALCGVVVTLQAADGSGYAMSQAITPDPDAFGYCEASANHGPYPFSFTGLNAGSYRLSVNVPAAYLPTLPAEITYDLADGQNATGATFGMSWPMPVQGTVWQDLNGNGSVDAGEAGIAGATVEIYRDVDHSGTINFGDSILASGLTDASGWYSLNGLPPGQHLLRSLLPGGCQTNAKALPIVSGEVTGTQEADLGALPGVLSGTVWKDVDGDGVVDPDEAPLPNALVSLDGGVSLATDHDGSFVYSGLAVGLHTLSVDPLSVPAGWVAENGSPVSIAVSSGANEVNLGYYDLLKPAEWNRECRQVGHPTYKPADLALIVKKAEETSQVFGEKGGICEILQKPGGGEMGRALKQDAALQLNMASGRLLPPTPVNLPGLTPVTTVGGVAIELETWILLPSATDKDLKRVAEIAENVNKGKGVGYGQHSTARLAYGLYDGKDVTSPLRTSGGTLDMQLETPAILSRWSPGGLSVATNVLRPTLRVKVQAFYDGAVLAAQQVLQDGTVLELGQAAPVLWNKDVSAVYSFNVWRASTLGELASSEFRLVVRDPNQDGGHREHAKVDYAELGFEY